MSKKKTIVNEEILDRPLRTDPLWTAYVMQQFCEDEIFDGKPTCDGLRRVFEKLIGPIISSSGEVISAPQGLDHSTTVKWSIQYYDSSLSHNNEPTTCTVGDCFNVNKENTAYPWYLSSVATASTKAEARALRKGLRLLKILSKEEIIGGIDNTDDLITSIDVVDNREISNTQRITIENQCKKMNINVGKLLKHMGYDKPLNNLAYSDAHKILNQLNTYQRGSINKGEDIPQDLISSIEDLTV